MFCVIQEVKTHRPSTGEPKRIEVYRNSWKLSTEEYYSYGWHYSEERFVRPLKPSYRISIHQSYRESGKVKKKQFVIGTAQYYDMAENLFTIYDSWYEKKILAIAEELSVETNEIYDLLNAKITPLEQRIQEEYRETEEYKAYVQNRKILDEYSKSKSDFSKEYEVDQNEYDKCYDVFGELRNSDCLEKIKRGYKERKEYEEKSRSYQGDFWSNYSKYFGGGGSSYHNSFSDNHKDEDKEMLKQFYRVLSKKFHPDANPDIDTSKEMQLLNRLKDEWGV